MMTDARIEACLQALAAFQRSPIYQDRSVAELKQMLERMFAEVFTDGDLDIAQVRYPCCADVD